MKIAGFFLIFLLIFEFAGADKEKSAHEAQFMTRLCRSMSGEKVICKRLAASDSVKKRQKRFFLFPVLGINSFNSGFGLTPFGVTSQFNSFNLLLGR
uniref:Uncharacterized protein n=1 Tax=Panagrolaimus sp. JU765 TaxID=591449 RepID=A0AC34RRF0_9BILA